MENILLSLIKACIRCKDTPCMGGNYRCDKLEKAIKQLSKK